MRWSPGGIGCADGLALKGNGETPAEMAMSVYQGISFSSLFVPVDGGWRESGADYTRGGVFVPVRRPLDVRACRNIRAVRPRHRCW